MTIPKKTKGKRFYKKEKKHTSLQQDLIKSEMTRKDTFNPKYWQKHTRIVDDDLL